MKEQAKFKAEEAIKQYEQSIKLLELLPDGPFDFLVNIHVQKNTVHVTIPFDMEVFKNFRRAMGKGWRCDNWSTTSFDTHATQSRAYWLAKNGDRWSGAYVMLSLDTKLDGTTCELKQVGVREEPVFEVVCN